MIYLQIIAAALGLYLTIFYASAPRKNREKTTWRILGAIIFIIAIAYIFSSDKDKKQVKKTQLQQSEAIVNCESENQIQQLMISQLQKENNEIRKEFHEMKQTLFSSRCLDNSSNVITLEIALEDVINNSVSPLSIANALYIKKEYKEAVA